LNEQHIKYCPHGGKNDEEIKEALAELLNSRNKPDAVFTASDRITTTTLALLKKNGIRIPEELGLLGFTNTHLADILNPPLSSVFQPGFEMGAKATQLLIGQIENKRTDEFETVVFPTSLFIRNSTKPGR
jgi:LacI family transcriptional regulator